MHYQVIHHTPGRLRVRSGRCAFNHDQAYGIECRLLKQKGVYSVKATPCNGGVFILYEGTSPQAIFRTLDRLRPETLRSHEPEERAEARKLARSFFLRIAGKASSFLLCKVFLPPPLRMAKAFWNYGSYLRRGMAGLGSGRLNVAVLDAVSIGVSIGTKAYGTANSIMFLLSISDLLENYTRKKTRAALAASLSINIDRVWRVEEGGMRQVPMEQIRPGEKIRVDAGNVIPVDGTVLSGEAEVNQAAMTGESEAASKREGSVVFAGTTLETGSLVIRVDAAGDQSRINNIIALIDHSEELKARIQSRAEKLADSIVPYTLLTTGALFLFTRNISKALSVLMVDYSCAIKLATPISVISAMKEAAARKIMIKGGKFMELFAKTDTIVFDKTGTLTSACPQVTQIIPLSDCSREYILKTAACLEEHFPHSVARAVVRKALEEGLHHEEEHAEVEYIVAHGISSRLHGKKVLVGSYHFLFEDERIPLTEEQRLTIRNHARGKSNIFLAIGRRAIGMIGVSDPPRPEAAETIARLKRQGISSIIMLTGDSESAARAISRQLGITEYRSQVLPEDKARFIQQLKKSGKTVCMVGDGINDSPALSCADVSVSMKDSSDIAREVADISLLSSSLAELVVLRELSCAVLEKIERNYRFIVGFNSSLILLGMFGLITPALSAFLHNASTVYVSARTPGYTRQRLDIASLNTQKGDFYNANSTIKVGFGVEMTGVSQLRDPFLDIQYRSQIAKVGTSDAHAAGYEQLATIFDEATLNGVRDALRSITSSLQTFSNQAGNDEFDSMVRSNMQVLLNLLRDDSIRLQDIRNDMQTGFATTDVPDVNELLQNIANLNTNIKNSQILGNPALELQDERNRLLDELASYLPISANYREQTVGPGYTVEVLDVVFTDVNGQKYKLISDGLYGSFDTETRELPVTLKVSDIMGNTTDITDRLGNGSLKGTLDILNKSGDFDNSDVKGLGYYEKALDKLAETFVKAFNEANVPCKMNPDGTVKEPVEREDDPDKMNPLFELIDPAKGYTAQNIKIADKWLSGEYRITKSIIPVDGKIGSTASDNINNMIDLMGKDHAFKVEVNANKTVTFFTGSFHDCFAELENTLGIDARSAETMLTNQIAVLNQTSNSRDAISGVSLDEEGMNLLHFNQSYNAAARLMTTLDEALDKLINGTGVVGR